MNNLIAYIPTLNQRHIDWFKRRDCRYLFLITQKMAEEFIPRLARNLSGVPTELMVKMIRSTGLVRNVSEFQPDWDDPRLALDTAWRNWFLPDEDVSYALAEKYLVPTGATTEFDMIWARWDMSAVHKEQPIIPDVIVDFSNLHNLRMRMAEAVSVNSPDWWRQIGAVAFDSNGQIMLSSCNTHMPNEYETYIFGDPRLNVDAGQKSKYTAIHSEQAVIALCAKHGLSISGGSVYVTTFPCEDCARWLAFAGVKKVFFREGYSVLNAQEVLRSNGVEIIQVVE